MLFACKTKTKSLQHIVNWEFEKLYAYNNKSIDPALKEMLQQSTIVFCHDTVIINGSSKAKFIRERETTDKFFGDNDTYKEFYVGIFRNKGVDISDSVGYIRLVDYDYDPNEFSFDSYSLWQTIICTDEYLCLPYNKFMAMLFKNPTSPDNRSLPYHEKDTKIVEQENTPNSSRSIIKPSAYSLPYKGKLDYRNINYELIAMADIEVGPGGWFDYNTIDTTGYISMQKKGEFDVIIIPQDCGDFPYRYYLYTLSGNKIIDDIYVEGDWWEPEYDGEVIKTYFQISSDYTIFVYTTSGGKTDLIEEYCINDQGKFQKIKD